MPKRKQPEEWTGRTSRVKYVAWHIRTTPISRLTPMVYHGVVLYMATDGTAHRKFKYDYIPAAQIVRWERVHPVIAKRNRPVSLKHQQLINSLVRSLYERNASIGNPRPAKKVKRNDTSSAA